MKCSDQDSTKRKKERNNGRKKLPSNVRIRRNHCTGARIALHDRRKREKHTYHSTASAYKRLADAKVQQKTHEIIARWLMDYIIMSLWCPWCVKCIYCCAHCVHHTSNIENGASRLLRLIRKLHVFPIWFDRYCQVSCKVAACHRRLTHAGP